MRKFSAIMLILFVSVIFCDGAEYLGRDVDGESYSCTAFSYSTSHYYELTCDFSGDNVTLHFPNGGYIVVSMDSDEIADPSSISAFDYNKGNYWDLDVNIE